MGVWILSRAALETLAIIAYRQPITQAEIEQIRGVAVDTIVKSLVDLQLVRLVGRSELPGHPFLYGTSPLFLEHFGLASLSELNDIDPTLQRSNPRERAKLFVKEKKPEEQVAEGTGETPKKDDERGADAVAVTGPAPDAAPVEDGAAEEAVQEEAEGPVDAEPSADEVAPRRVSFRPDDEAEEDDEPLVDEAEEDDEPLVDDTPDEFDDEDDEDDEFDEDDAEVGDVPEGEEDEE